MVQKVHFTSVPYIMTCGHSFTAHLCDPCPQEVTYIETYRRSKYPLGCNCWSIPSGFVYAASSNS